MKLEEIKEYKNKNLLNLEDKRTDEYHNVETLAEALQNSLDCFALKLQMELVGVLYRPRTDSDDFQTIRCISFRLGQVNRFFGTSYETQPDIIIDYYTKPLTKL